MALDDFIGDPHDDELTQKEVAEQIEEWTGVEPFEMSNGPRFYARRVRGEPEEGTLFALVLPGPRLLVDPTVKEGVSGQTPKEVREHSDFEETVSYDDSLGYSIELNTEIPDMAQLAVERSYGCFSEPYQARE